MMAHLPVQFVEIRNPHDFAVDLTGWTLAGSVEWPGTPGVVIAAKDSLFVARDVPSFLTRSQSPRVSPPREYSLPKVEPPERRVSAKQ